MTEKQHTILVVDDEEMSRDMLSRWLQKKGYVVFTAENGKQALNIIVEYKFDLVLLDIMMPEMDGITVLKLIRKTYPKPELPIIMVTAKGESGDIVHALELGANDYVTKPIDMAVALARIKTQLGMKEASNQNKQLLKELEERNEFIRNIFGRYVASEIVEELLKSPEALRFDGELLKVSILFADLKGFTSISEKLLPKQIVSMLNNYLTMMIEIIIKYRGIVDELLGDGIMAFYGVPVGDAEGSQKAIACAVEMQKAMDAVSESNIKEGFPELRMGIGIDTGEVVVGNIGCERRSKYSVIGKHVNLAFHIESSAKGGEILISESTLNDAGAIVRIETQREIKPKGLKNPIKVYEISGIGGNYEVFMDTKA